MTILTKQAREELILDIEHVIQQDIAMKTTLTLDDDVADYLKEQCRLDDKPFERVVNETLRRGMEMSAPSESAADGGEDSEAPPFKVVPFSSKFAPEVDQLKLNQVNADLEMEELIRKVKRNDNPGH